jgi:hypothetical protein
MSGRSIVLGVMRDPRRGLLLVTAAAAALAATTLGGCWGDSGPPNPVPISALTLDAGGGGGGASPLPEAGVPRRTVEWRSLFGGPAGNLLVDGDFEFSAAYEGWMPQIGWMSLDSQTYDIKVLAMETGGLCRTGLRCGVLEYHQFLLGQGTAARGTGMVASLSVKPPPGRGCDVAMVALISCATYSGDHEMLPRSPDPAPDGWCTFEDTLSTREVGVCFYVESQLAKGETALLDSALLLPDDGTAPLASQARPLSAERAARVQRARDELKRRRIFGDPSALRPPIPRP